LRKNAKPDSRKRNTSNLLVFATLHGRTGNILIGVMIALNNAPPGAEPPIALHDFLRAVGVQPITGWRWRKAGILKTFQICGRQYVSREEVRRFNARAESGEFSTPLTPPRNRGRKKLE
jgi:hypothetical protein